ncbi:HNH/endonuclease VII fold toxin-2 domain-containing protein [Acidovorax sp. Leaf78]|jgi:hypothetical protein|uniref:HNH/endonuclease VII fold toxin-2 domain-containing protein n=1 Tax=Acidovorax sp. Leaf78 TaxID=1736237 RepID=UPI0009EBBB31|nr:HNH/endonuclease VII fold toxin-2 domain-containing protein [Acidovorax sp. Leaf78]
MAVKKKTGSKDSSKDQGKKPAASQKGAPNTGRHIYMDTAASKAACAKDKGAIDKNCKPESESAKSERQKKEAPPLLNKLKLPSHTGKASNPNAQWVNDHCEFLMIKPSSPEDMFKELEKIPEQMAEELGVKALQSVEAKAKEKLEQAIKNKAAKTAGKQVVGRVAPFLGGPWVGIAANVLMTADGAMDMAQAAKEFPDIASEISEASQKLKDAQAKIADMKGHLDKYKNPDGTYKKQEMVSDMMKGAAVLNPCIRARRCALVPYKETEKEKAGKDGAGCCPGQSGHHVLPSSMFKDCPDYKPNEAPTVCVEGTNNTHGSHGDVHKDMGKELGKLEYPNKQPIPKGAQITKNQAIEAGAKSVKSAFAVSGCETRCLEAQLHSFYDKLNCMPKNESGQSSGGTADKPSKTK